MIDNELDYVQMAYFKTTIGVRNSFQVSYKYVCGNVVAGHDEGKLVGGSSFRSTILLVVMMVMMTTTTTKTIYCK